MNEYLSAPSYLRLCNLGYSEVDIVVSRFLVFRRRRLRKIVSTSWGASTKQDRIGFSLPAMSITFSVNLNNQHIGLFRDELSRQQKHGDSIEGSVFFFHKKVFAIR